MKTLVCTVIAGGVLVLTGCETTNQGSKTYTRAQAQRPMTAQNGTVMAAQDVTIQASQSGGGAVGGGIVGGILGHALVGKSGPATKRVGATLGALAGAAGGSVAEKKLGQKTGIELMVKLADDSILVVVQEKDEEFAVGDKVRVITSPDGATRVTR